MSIGILHFFIEIVNSDSLLAILDSRSDGYESSHYSSAFMFAKVFMANSNANASGTGQEFVKGIGDDNTPFDLTDHVAREAITQRRVEFLRILAHLNPIIQRTSIITPPRVSLISNNYKDSKSPLLYVTI